MIFCARQLQEKAREQNVPLYAIFFDLQKAFDTVNRAALWIMLAKLGCPDSFISVVRQLHDGMLGHVIISGTLSDPFEIKTGVKQGCVLAPLLFIIFYSFVIRESITSCTDGVYIRFRTDGKLFNLSRLRAKSKVQLQLIQELLYADDCVFFASSEADLQAISSSFACAAKGLA